MGEYKGKMMFEHRYVGMSESAIREEIDRLQGELYAMQEALDFLSEDGKESRKAIVEGQRQNERLIKQLEEKVEKLKYTLDYESPVKTQITAATKEISGQLQKDFDSKMAKVILLGGINTVLLIIAICIIVLSLIH